MRIAVIGAGTMGIGVASVIIANGFAESISIFVRDKSKNAAVDSMLVKNVKRYLRQSNSAFDANELIAKYNIVNSVSELSEHNIVIEAISENLENKIALFKQLESIVERDCKVFSNTSSLSISALADCLEDSSRFAGLHFFNPVTHLPIVEMVSHEHTSAKTLETMKGLIDNLKMEFVEVKDHPGFVVNKLLIPLINSASKLLEKNVCSAQDIDKVMTLAAKHPIGPFALADIIGIDVVVAILNSLYSAEAIEENKPSQILLNMLGQGVLGKKTKAGFYSY